MIADAVVDASVGIKLLIEEPGSLEADRLFAVLAASPPARFYVPDLFFIECANILWKYVRRFGYPAENARSDIADLLVLDLSAISTTALLPMALEQAIEYDITVYDACYVVLAQELTFPLVTADKKLLRKLADSEVEVKYLMEF
jgi:predicted nucleic acid-binding protein